MPKLYFKILPGADTKTLSGMGYDMVRRLSGSDKIMRKKNGKPYLPELSGFHFNISHSAHALALAVHNKPVGVDVERLRQADFRIARRFFTADEQEYIGGDCERFFEVWTKKEAYLKYTGEGLKRSLNTFSVFALPDVIFKTQAQDGYIISICSSMNPDKPFTAFTFLV